MAASSILQVQGCIHGPLLQLREFLNLLGQSMLRTLSRLAETIGMIDQAQDHHFARTALDLFLLHRHSFSLPTETKASIVFDF
jgi:hypothetical protein